jgi:hypothetical protein
MHKIGNSVSQMGLKFAITRPFGAVRSATRKDPLRISSLRFLAVDAATILLSSLISGMGYQWSIGDRTYYPFAMLAGNLTRSRKISSNVGAIYTATCFDE